MAHPDTPRPDALPRARPTIPVRPALPSPAGGRYVTLDIARGIAILGTLASNIWLFSHPGGVFGLFQPVTAGTPPAHALVINLLQDLANGKFLGLLTLMFGMGLAIQADSAARRGRRWPGRYPWRMLILFLDGLLHYLLVVEFDILMGYAITGAVAAYVIATSERAQRIWFWLATGVHVVLVGLATVLFWWADNADPAGTGEAPRDFSDSPYRVGTWWDLVVMRVHEAPAFRLEPVFILAFGVAMFLLGHRLYHAGVLTEQGHGLRRRMLLAGALALPVDLGLALASGNWFVLTRYGTAPIVALGLFALIVELHERRQSRSARTQHSRLAAQSSSSWWGRRLAEVGRVALSAYVLQNLLASTVFYGWGLNLGAVPPTWRLGVTVAAWTGICALLLLGAHLWLRYFRRGPLEWVSATLYRTLARA